MGLFSDDKVPNFLPKTTLETAPTESFLFKFEPHIPRTKEKAKANINVYNKEISKESREESVDLTTDYDYLKFFVDFQKVPNNIINRNLELHMF